MSDDRGGMPDSEGLYQEITELVDEGTELLAQGDWVEAVHRWERAAELFRQAGDPWPAANLLNDVARVCYDHGDVGRALKYLQSALEIRQELAPRSIVTADVLNNMGAVYQAQGDLEKALECYQRALEIDEAIVPRSRETARDLNNIGSVHQARGELEKALEYHQRALEISQAIAPHSKETATYLNNIGFVYYTQGDLGGALQYYERALAIFETIVPRPQEIATNLNNIGLVYQAQGNLDKALEYYQRALEIDETIGLRSQQTARYLNNIGLVYQAQGDIDKALEYYQRALQINEAIAPWSKETATNLNNIGSAYCAQGHLERALEFFRRALEIDEAQAPWSKETARDLHNVGSAHEALGDIEKALEYYQRALEIDRAIASRSQAVATNLYNIGSVYQAQGNIEGALEYYRQALEIDEAVAPGSRETARDLNAVALVLGGLGNWPEAERYLERAMEVVEALRVRAGLREEARTGAVHKYMQVYPALAWTKHKLSKDAEALHISERGRAQGMREMLAEAEVERTVLAPEEAAELDRLRRRLAAVEARLIDLRSTPEDRRPLDYDELLRRLEDEERQRAEELEAFEIQLRRTHAEFADIAYPQALTADGIQQMLAPETGLIEYSIWGAECLAWAVTADKLVAVHLPVEEESIRRAVKDWRADLTDRHSDRWQNGPAAEYLRRLLPVGLLDAVAECERLVIIPDRELHLIPFEALTLDGMLLGERWPVLYAPSASVLAEIDRRMRERAGEPESGELIGFGYPFLRDEPASGHESWERDFWTRRGMDCTPMLGMKTELGVLYELYEGAGAPPGPLAAGDRARIYLEHLATERRVFEEAGGYSIVHFATHAAINDQNPMHGVILLASPEPGDEEYDALLETVEVFALKLKADLVLLSACNTGLGRVLTGEGIVGMTRAFTLAGAASLVASLWPVHDPSTAQLMAYLHEELLAGREKATALKNAKERLRRELPIYAHPYYWAPFILLGTWQRRQSGPRGQTRPSARAGAGFGGR